MIVSLVKNQVKLEGVDEYIKVATKFAQDMKSIEGCIDSYLLQDIENKSVVVNVVIWKNKEYMEKDDGSIFIKYKPELKKYFLGNQTEILSVIL